MCPFTVIIDSNEQHPYLFNTIKADADQNYAPLIIPAERKSLKSGDYSILGHETGVAIERKSKSDAFSTFINERDSRGIPQLQRLHETIDASSVVIECSLSSLLQGPDRVSGDKGRKLGKCLYRSILAWQQRYPTVHWWFMPTRDWAEAHTFRTLERYWKELNK